MYICNDYMQLIGLFKFSKWIINHVTSVEFLQKKKPELCLTHMQWYSKIVFTSWTEKKWRNVITFCILNSDSLNCWYTYWTYYLIWDISERNKQWKKFWFQQFTDHNCSFFPVILVELDHVAEGEVADDVRVQNEEGFIVAGLHKIFKFIFVYSNY